MRPINSKSFGQTGLVCLFSDSGHLYSGWVEKQIGSSRYIVSNGTVTKTCQLATSTSDASTLPDGTCTFVVSHTLNANDEYVKNLSSTKCVTTADNIYAWHTGLVTSSQSRIVNNAVYYNIEQGLIHAGPISGETISASFTLTKATSLRIRLPLVQAETYGNANFTLTLNPDNNTSPDLGTVLATQTFFDADVFLSSDRIFLEFTNASTVYLNPARYWVSITDNFSNSPVTSSGAAWFWDSNLVDAAVQNEYSYVSAPSPGVYPNVPYTTAYQMSIEALD